MDLRDLALLAREHADRLVSDLELTTSRVEHVRLTARANEAENLAGQLQQLVIQEAAREIG
jgi:hypothetical protein